MENNSRNFKRYVFLSSFARNLTEVFIGSILFKLGFCLKDIILYYLLANIFSVIIGIPCSMLSKKYSNKLLAVIGILSFILLQIFLNYISLNKIWLFIIAFLFALYRRGYWISRRYFTLQVIDNNNISKKFSVLSIVNQLGVILSSYLGAIVLQFVSVGALSVFSIILLIFSLCFVYKLKFDFEKNDTKINLFETLKVTPVSTIIHISCFELQNVVKFLLPLCIIIYVRNTYTAVGLVSLIANIATLLFTYFYGVLINDKRNYLKFSIIFVLIARILQVNTFGVLLMIASFLEGLSFKMYEQSFNKEYLILSKKYEFHNINFMYEMLQNVARLIVVLIIYLFVDDIRVMIYVVLAAISIALFFKFKTSPNIEKSEVLWNE